MLAIFLRRERKADRSLADQISLFAGSFHEAKAVLKSLAITDLSGELYQRRFSREMKLQFDASIGRQLTGHRSRQASLADVLGASMEHGSGA